MQPTDKTFQRQCPYKRMQQVSRTRIAKSHLWQGNCIEQKLHIICRGSKFRHPLGQFLDLAALMEQRWRGNGTVQGMDLNPLDDFDALFQFACESAGPLPRAGGPAEPSQQVSLHKSAHPSHTWLHQGTSSTNERPFRRRHGCICQEQFLNSGAAKGCEGCSMASSL